MKVENNPKEIKRPEDAQLGPLLLNKVKNSGYTDPNSVQKHGIPIIMYDKDLMACASSGSGKTAAFLLPTLHGLMKSQAANKHLSVRAYSLLNVSCVLPQDTLIRKIKAETKLVTLEDKNHDNDNHEPDVDTPPIDNATSYDEPVPGLTSSIRSHENSAGTSSLMDISYLPTTINIKAYHHDQSH